MYVFESWSVSDSRSSFLPYILTRSHCKVKLFSGLRAPLVAYSDANPQILTFVFTYIRGIHVVSLPNGSKAIVNHPQIYHQWVPNHQNMVI